MSDFSEISKLLRQLADAFDNLGGGASSSNGEITISGEVTRDADCRAFNKRDGSIGHFTRINVKMPRPINDTLFANCIAWTDKFEYQFQRGDKVEFRGHFEKNNRGYYDFMIAESGNLKPKHHTSETSPDDDNEPF